VLPTVNQKSMVLLSNIAPLQNRLATLQAPTVIGSGSRIYLAKTGLLERSMSAPGH
jgi:hypothetical protein